MGNIYISFDEPIIVTCPRCGGGRGDFVNPCDWCGATGGVPPDGADDRLATLAHNLAIAGGLCAAFLYGAHYGFWEGGCRVSSDDPEEINPSWSPGCGTEPDWWPGKRRTP